MDGDYCKGQQVTCGTNTGNAAPAQLLMDGVADNRRNGIANERRQKHEGDDGIALLIVNLELYDVEVVSMNPAWNGRDEVIQT